MQYILVYGAPATGKTTLATSLAEKLTLPLVRKDAFKELLFDTLGYGTKEISEQYGHAARALLYHTLTQNLAAQTPAVYEATFNPREDAEQLYSLFQTHQARGIEIFCTAPAEVITQRFFQRQESGNRHPGHHFIPRADTVLAEYLEKFYELNVGQHTFVHDTTHFSQTNDLIDRVLSAWDTPLTQNPLPFHSLNNLPKKTLPLESGSVLT